ncbi:MAG: CehA/McbA family metallohydrolase [Candidatus Merdivicinus sp.]|jgi:predicted metal-dependent phosphoesterase TrpH
MYLDGTGKKWWKGNLHAHTTNSDGRRSPQEVISLYQKQDYDFLAITDHWVLSETKMQDSMLLLAGCEYDVGLRGLAESGVYHLVAIGMHQSPDLHKQPHLTAQQVLDAIHRAGGYAILAHPAWSLNRPDEILKLNGIDASEIYNTLSGTPWNGRRADSSVILDTLSAAGMRIPCVASDDAHFYTGEHCRSFIWLQAEELTECAVMDALRAGHFYASQGPKMEVSVSGKTVKVRCSAASMVVFYSNLVWSSNRVVSGENLTEAEYSLQPDETFVRVEVVDAKGNLAWSSPITVQEA